MTAWCAPGTHVDVGRVRQLGDNLARTVMAAPVELTPDPSERSDAYVVALPPPTADAARDDRARHEARVLARLAALDLPFRVPEPVGVVDDDGRPLLVRRYLRGLPLDLRAGRQLAEPWTIVGAVAAAIHAIRDPALDAVLGGHATWRDHALDRFRSIEGREGTPSRALHAWAVSQLRPEPSVVLHGDLLGQNLLLGVGWPDAVIDWDYATRGDPAYDLAIVTRGARQPFQVAGGLDRLLEAYWQAGGSERVTRTQVQLHEMCLVLDVARAALARGDHGAAQPALQTFERLTRRVTQRG